MTTRDAAKAALYTGLFTSLGAFVLALTGWLTDVVEWATSDGATVAFPDPSILVKAGVALVAGLAGAAVNFAYRWLQGRLGWGEAPTYARVRKA